MLVIKNKENNIKYVNFGIEILRMVLCFWVLSFHSLEKDKINYPCFYISKTKFYHVPCFSFISFYFSYNIFSERNIIKFKRRIERLLIPYIIWPLIIVFINIIFQNKNTISLYHLKIQFICGRQFMVPLWYLFSMIILTITFFIISNIFQIHFLLVFQLLGIISYISQYSGYYNLLNEYKNNVKKPILDTLSILPLASIGLFFSSTKLIKFFQANKKTSMFFSYLFIYFLFKYDIFIDLGGYEGIINMFSSLFFFIGFYLLPLENTYSFLKIIIKQITSYTNGIYCLQSKIIPFIKTKFHLYGTIKSCFIIYSFSYFFSFVGIKIFGKTKLKYLFI